MGWCAEVFADRTTEMDLRLPDTPVQISRIAMTCLNSLEEGIPAKNNWIYLSIHAVKDYIRKGLVKFDYVTTSDNLANMLRGEMKFDFL